MYSNNTIAVTVVVKPDSDGFHAYAPAFKGLHVGGDTKEEALKNVCDGILWYMESLMENGEPLPLGPYLSISAKPEEPSLPEESITENLFFQWSFQKMSRTSLRT